MIERIALPIMVRCDRAKPSTGTLVRSWPQLISDDCADQPAVDVVLCPRLAT